MKDIVKGLLAGLVICVLIQVALFAIDPSAPQYGEKPAGNAIVCCCDCDSGDKFGTYQVSGDWVINTATGQLCTAEEAYASQQPPPEPPQKLVEFFSEFKLPTDCKGRPAGGCPIPTPRSDLPKPGVQQP